MDVVVWRYVVKKENEGNCIPKVTIWIRQDDWDLWLAIEDRPAFIHNALVREEIETQYDKPLKTPKLTDLNIPATPEVLARKLVKDFGKPHQTYFKKGKK